MLSKPPECRNPLSPESMLLGLLGHFWGHINDKDIRQEIDILCNLLESKIEKKSVKKTAVGNDERFFIQFFKQKYLELVDLEYSRPIKAEDMSLIKGLTKQLKEKNLGVEEYLIWVFDVYYKDSTNSFLPTIKMICGNHIFGTFLMRNKDKINKKKKEVESASREGSVREYANRLYRMTNNDEIRKIVEKFDAGVLNLSDMERLLKETINEIQE